jgi:hypothetical protein
LCRILEVLVVRTGVVGVHSTVSDVRGWIRGTRVDPPAMGYMWGMASQLDDEMIKDLASYYATGTPSTSTPAWSSCNDSARIRRAAWRSKPPNVKSSAAACASRETALRPFSQFPLADSSKVRRAPTATALGCVVEPISQSLCEADRVAIHFEFARRQMDVEVLGAHPSHGHRPPSR